MRKLLFLLLIFVGCSKIETEVFLMRNNDIVIIHNYTPEPEDDILVYGKLKLQENVESILFLKYVKGFPEDPEYHSRNLYLLNIKEKKLCSIKENYLLIL